MLQNEYIKLAKSVDYVSEKQAKETITIVLDKIKVDANAAIAEVWIIEHGQTGRRSGKRNCSVVKLAFAAILAENADRAPRRRSCCWGMIMGGQATGRAKRSR